MNKTAEHSAAPKAPDQAGGALQAAAGSAGAAGAAPTAPAAAADTQKSAPVPVPDSRRIAELQAKVIEALHSVYDPEIPVDIYELGLIYSVDVRGEDNHVEIRMTLTSPACPVAGTLPVEVDERVRAIPEVASCHVELVWDPPWDMTMMSESARLQLNLF